MLSTLRRIHRSLPVTGWIPLTKGQYWPFVRGILLSRCQQYVADHKWIIAWSRHYTEMLSALLALCEVKPQVTSGILSQKADNADCPWVSNTVTSSSYGNAFYFTDQSTIYDGFFSQKVSYASWPGVSDRMITSRHGVPLCLAGPLWEKSTGHLLFPGIWRHDVLIAWLWWIIWQGWDYIIHDNDK